MTTDKAWAAMTEVEREALVCSLLWPNEEPIWWPRATTSSWPGFGLVYDKLNSEHYEIRISNKIAEGYCWAYVIAPDGREGVAQGAHPAETLALAAVRAMEAEK